MDFDPILDSLHSNKQSWLMDPESPLVVCVHHALAHGFLTALKSDPFSGSAVLGSFDLM